MTKQVKKANPRLRIVVSHRLLANLIEARKEMLDRMDIHDREWSKIDGLSTGAFMMYLFEEGMKDKLQDYILSKRIKL